MGVLTLFDGVAAPSDGAWSVSQVTQRARQLVEAGFPRLWVRGEIVGFKTYRSGHWYFALRDRTAQVRCVVWRRDAERMARTPEDGLEVFAHAEPTLWEEKGEFRLTVRQILPARAEGDWQLRLERAREALARDGLLDPARKRPLPPLPCRIGIVTSPDGAALRDVVAILRRRWPAVEVVLVPARVQGETAVVELTHALSLVEQLALDVVIVGRGGGSREDLWTFNDERVARAVAAVPVPTVSAVGHETDVTLTDLVADVRAPTPSAAAETVVPDRAEQRERVDTLARRMTIGLLSRVELGAQRLDRTGDRLGSATSAVLHRARALVERDAASLEALSPLRVLGRGYAMARDASGRVLRRVEDFPANRRFRLTVQDGEVAARVSEAGA